MMIFVNTKMEVIHPAKRSNSTEVIKQYFGGEACLKFLYL